MKYLLKIIIQLLNTYWLNIFNKGAILNKNLFFKFDIQTKGTNDIRITGCTLEKGLISVVGKKNIVHINNAYASEATIRIEGDQNELNVYENVKLRNANIIIRGSGCKIEIRRNTTFGGVRIVNVGKDNLILIGENCLFADQIEIWGSDTHPIFNEFGQVINAERPIFIGNRIWVGSRVTILKGVSILDGSIIGMGSVVTKDVPAGVISAGYPNLTIRENVTWQLNYPETNLVKGNP